MSLNEIRGPVAADLRAVDDLILRRLQSDVVLINQIGHYIVNSGGKRLRPLSVLLSARACGYSGERHIDLAAVIEFIHTATLLHDDVVDGSEQRRHRDTANTVWGNAASVLVGDFLYSRSFEMMVEVGSMAVMDILSHATNRISEGEVLQLLNCNDPTTTEARYMEVIERKTATLFEAGTRLGAVLAESSPGVERGMADYGRCLGVAFQLVDDALDYRAKGDELGKNLGDDLREGKPTLPLILALQMGTSQQASRLREAIAQSQSGLAPADIAALLHDVLCIVRDSGALEAARAQARLQADAAVSALDGWPDNAHVHALRELAQSLQHRTA